MCLLMVRPPSGLCAAYADPSHRAWQATRRRSVLGALSFPLIPEWQAKLTFAMARHVAVDISQVFRIPPRPPAERFDIADMERLRSSLASVGLVLQGGQDSYERLSRLRAMYEPYVNSLAGFLLMPLPPWLPDPKHSDNWQTSIWEPGCSKVAEKLD